MSLAARLRARIAAEGPISFAAFMEAALYDEQDGFYARGPALGLGGQFSTAPTRHPKFAEAVAAELREVGGAYVEVGPGDGTLAAAMPSGTEVVLVERAAGMRARQLAKVPRARWVDRPEDAGVVRGLVVANELFDALPVHLLHGDDELCVTDGGDRFTWARRPAPAPLRAFAAGAPPDQLVAVCPGLEPMLASLAAAIGEGRLLLIDYGADGPAAGPAPVRTYVGGRAGGEVLQAPGTQDLTADVDFARLRAAAPTLGLRELGYGPQSAWLRSRTLRPLAGTEAWYVERALEELPFQVLRLERGQPD